MKLSQTLVAEDGAGSYRHPRLLGTTGEFSRVVYEEMSRSQTTYAED